MTTSAQTAFTTRKAAIDALIARLAAHSAANFGAKPDAINWGDVGSLGYVEDKLRMITDFVFSEGECAR